jgi:pyruvate,water dikinase
VRVEVGVERRDVACLGHETLARLVDVGKRVERHFGSHQDVEWAIARDGGDLFLVQARPVTGLAKKADKPKQPASAMSLIMSTFGAAPKND